jgi:hypothetical protein
MENHLALIITITATLIGGGAAGAIIKAIIDKRRNKIQPIKKSVEISNIFVPNKIVDNFVSKITLTGSTSSYYFDDMQIVKIELTNNGNKDFKEFAFGVTFSDDIVAVNVKTNTSDRHHVVDFTPEVYFNSPTQIIDFKLSPFNRKDIYRFEILLTAGTNMKETDISFSTIEPIRFIDSNTISVSTIDLIKAILTGVMEVKIR